MKFTLEIKEAAKEKIADTFAYLEFQQKKFLGALKLTTHISGQRLPI